MNKYELAVVVSAKIEDDERAATLEKVKSYVERFGGQITNVDEWGKKRLAYEVQKMKEAFYYFIKFDAEPTVPAEIESRIRVFNKAGTEPYRLGVSAGIARYDAGGVSSLDALLVAADRSMYATKAAKKLAQEELKESL